jgi:hypothetical protein
MIPEEKIQEIRKKLKKGYPQGELINDFLKQGYSEIEIQDALYKLSNSKNANNKSTDFPIWYTVCAGLLITGISILNIFHNSALGFFFLIPGIAGIIIRFILKPAKQNE